MGDDQKYGSGIMKRANVHIHESKVSRAELAPLDSEIIRTLLYFDIFSFPLSMEEIHVNCSIPLENKGELLKRLKFLSENGFVKCDSDQYFINGSRDWIDRKQNGAAVAKKYLRRSRWMNRLIGQFPFVRGIGISGSLSKGYADDSSDVDYFIITQKGRLWLSRTLIILFKKIFLLNSRKWLCPNYFVDEKSLKIPDENAFTATEIVYLKPVYNRELFEKFSAENQWVRRFKPNFKMENRHSEATGGHSWIKRMLEWGMGGKVGDILDDYCFRLTYHFWKRKFNDYEKKEFHQAFRSKKNISKHHPQNFQKKVLKALNEREQTFEDRFQVKLAKGDR